jgi:hypothetical protein
MKKSVSIMMLALMPLAHANDQCVLQDRTVTRTTATILERGTIRRDIVPDIGGNRKCIVDFRVRIDAEWHTAYGEHTWPGNTSGADACAIAVTKAENDVRDRVGKRQTVSEKTLVCKDRPELMTLTKTQLGTIGDAGQFRPHPSYPNRFWHNGAQCRWFVEPSFTGRDIHNFQGIVCEVQNGRWVVLDKF